MDGLSSLLQGEDYAAVLARAGLGFAAQEWVGQTPKEAGLPGQ